MSDDVLLPVSRWELIQDRLMRLSLRRLVAAHARKGRPRLVCIPSDAIGQVIVLHGLYEADLLTALFDRHFADRRAAFAESTVLDVGANIGNHTTWFSPRFARVVSFEPNPPALAVLRANVVVNDLDNVDVIPVGLSDAEAELTFVEDPVNLGGSRFAVDGEGRVRTLTVRRGDDVLAALDLPPVAMIKIDVEGHEVRALTGLSATLEEHRPLVLFESHGTADAGGGHAVFSLLRERGYTRFDVIEPRTTPTGSRLVRFLKLLLSGGDLVARTIAEPEDRFYALIVASMD